MHEELMRVLFTLLNTYRVIAEHPVNNCPRYLSEQVNDLQEQILEMAAAMDVKEEQ